MDDLKIKQALELYKKPKPNGIIVDADTILCDLTESVDMRINGLGEELLNIYLKSKDKESIERIFLIFTDTKFEDYVTQCIEKTTKQKG